MINLQIDEAYALDYLSILKVKCEKIQTEIACFTYTGCIEEIAKQIGEGKLKEIQKSDIYMQLYKANLHQFNLLEELGEGENFSAREIDNINRKRYTLKQKLQKKFFGNEVKEIKSKCRPEKYKHGYPGLYGDGPRDEIS